MSKMNILVYLNAYKDSNPSNNPTLNSFKWGREMQGLTANKAQSIEFSLAPGESRTMFDGQRALSSNGTTAYDLTLKSGNTFSLKNVAGTSPSFRTLRSIASDATTQITVTTNVGLMRIESTAGTSFNFSTSNVGDEVSVDAPLNMVNRGKFKIIGKTSNSITVENSSAVAEGAILLGAGFADAVRVYSAAGVQKGDKVQIGAGFSLVSQRTYEVTAVGDGELEFYSSDILPNEANILAPTITIYSFAKKLVYIETDKPVAMDVNGVAESKLEPFVEGNNTLPGVYMKKSTMWAMTITNTSTDTAILYFASIE